MEQSFNWLKSQNRCSTTAAALPIHTTMDWQHLPPPHPSSSSAGTEPQLSFTCEPQAAQLIRQGKEVWSLLGSDRLGSCELHRQHGVLHQEYFLGLGCHMIPAVPISTPQATLGRGFPEVTVPTGTQNGTRYQCPGNQNLPVSLPK